MEVARQLQILYSYLAMLHVVFNSLLDMHAVHLLRVTPSVYTCHQRLSKYTVRQILVTTVRDANRPKTAGLFGAFALLSVVDDRAAPKTVTMLTTDGVIKSSALLATTYCNYLGGYRLWVRLT